MHLFGFIIRIYHDTRSPEGQIKKKARTYVHIENELQNDNV